MANIQETFHDAITGQTVTRELTDEEMQTMIDHGWTPSTNEDQNAR